MSSAATVQPFTTVDLETRLAALGIPVARLTAAAGIARSTWSDWRAGRTRPRPDRWAAVTAAFDALVAEASSAPPHVEPQATGSAPVILTGSSAPTGAPPSFTPVATAAPASESASAVDATSSDVDALIAGVLPPGDVVSQSDRARALIERDRAVWVSLCDQPTTDPRFAEAARLDDARDMAVGNLTASPARTPGELAAKASVILAGLGDKPAGWLHEVTPFVDLVQSMAADAVRLGQAPAGAAAEGEPIVATLGRVADLWAVANADVGSDAERDAACVTMSGLVEEAATMPISTQAGAMAALAYVRDEFAFTQIEAHREPLRSATLTLKLLDNALGALRRSAMLGGSPRSVSAIAPSSFAADLSALAELTAMSDRLARLTWDCSERTSWPEVPEALFFRAGDPLSFRTLLTRHTSGRSWFPPTAIDHLRNLLFDRVFADPSGRDRRRRDEIVAAHDAWQDDRAAASEASGLTAIEAESRACAALLLEPV